MNGQEDDLQLFIRPFIGWKWLSIYRSRDNGDLFLGSPYTPTIWPKRAELQALCRDKELCQEFPEQRIRRVRVKIGYSPEEGARLIETEAEEHERIIPATYEQVPSKKGWCGIYAFESLELAKAYTGSKQFAGSVLCKVKLYGDVVPGDRAHRAQYAYPASLHEAFCLNCRERVPISRTHLVRRGVRGVRVAGFIKYGTRCFRCAGGGYKNWYHAIAEDYGIDI